MAGGRGFPRRQQLARRAGDTSRLGVLDPLRPGDHERGADVGAAFHFTGFGEPPVPGPEPSGRPYGTHATFSDPDGNSWLLQEVKTRLPGRGFSSLDVETLTDLLQDAEVGHGKYEPTAPKHHWSAWYSAYIVARQRGKGAEEAAQDAALHTERTLR